MCSHWPCSRALSSHTMNLAGRTQDCYGFVCRTLPHMQRPEHPIQTSEQLLELSQGDWEGQVRSECYTVSSGGPGLSAGWDLTRTSRWLPPNTLETV